MRFIHLTFYAETIMRPSLPGLAAVGILPNHDNRPTLHHLNVCCSCQIILIEVVLTCMQHSQSQRILWLLEELQVRYNLVLHYRDLDFRAPEGLANASPDYQKSPFLIPRACDRDLYGPGIPESYAIAKYLVRQTLIYSALLCL